MWASGNASIAICDRCNRKRPYRCLRADGNSPGLRVCSDSDCYDPRNPWRDPPIQPDAITLRYPRPDVPLTFGPRGASPFPPGHDGFIITEDGLFFLTTEDEIPLIVESVSTAISTELLQAMLAENGNLLITEA